MTPDYELPKNFKAGRYLLMKGQVVRSTGRHKARIETRPDYAIVDKGLDFTTYYGTISRSFEETFLTVVGIDGKRHQVMIAERAAGQELQPTGKLVAPRLPFMAALTFFSRRVDAQAQTKATRVLRKRVQAIAQTHG